MIRDIQPGRLNTEICEDYICIPWAESIPADQDIKNIKEDMKNESRI